MPSHIRLLIRSFFAHSCNYFPTLYISDAYICHNLALLDVLKEPFVYLYKRICIWPPFHRIHQSLLIFPAYLCLCPGFIQSTVLTLKLRRPFQKKIPSPYHVLSFITQASAQGEHLTTRIKVHGTSGSWTATVLIGKLVFKNHLSRISKLQCEIVTGVCL